VLDEHAHDNVQQHPEWMTYHPHGGIELVHCKHGRIRRHLEWKTATDKVNFGFEVERSFDGCTWSTINLVP
jgi:hypothetical protein